MRVFIKKTGGVWPRENGADSKCTPRMDPKNKVAFLSPLYIRNHPFGGKEISKIEHTEEKYEFIATH